MQDPLALAEERLAARELRPALDALKEARVRAYAARDRAALERVRALALQLRPLLGGGRAERSCVVLLVAVDEGLALLPEDAVPEPPAANEEPEPAEEPAPPPEAGPEPEPPAEEPPSVAPGVPPGHVQEAETVVLEPGERLLGMFAGEVHETRDDGRRGGARSKDGVQDYLLVTDRGVVLWSRGREAGAEGYRFAEVTDAEAVRGVFSRSVVMEVGERRRWFASMKRDDAELAAELIRDLAGLRR